ncbi:MAG: hypothetical protein AAGB31_02950 [Bdellovibrio sp.]
MLRVISLNMALCLLYLAIFTGCASLSKQGYQALEEGQYEKALTLFEKAVQNNADDGEAKEGLRQAQQEWLNRKLIDVRLLRLGENIGESESLLLKIIQQENNWQVFPTGVAFATQQEEILLFSERVQKRIHGLIAAGNPLAAQIEFNKNSFILGEARAQNLSLLKNKIYTEALKFCKNTHNSLKSHEYYTALWLQQTCAAWQIPLKSLKLKNSVALFKSTKIESKVQQLSPDLEDILNKNIEAAFLHSKWYDAQGNANLDLQTEGLFSSKVSETPVHRVQEYTVQIPYKETFKRVKDPNKNNGAQGVLNFLAVLGGTAPSEHVVDNNDGTETVTVTKYRPETRYHSYNATALSAEKLLNGKVQARLDKQTFSMDFKQTFQFQRDRHNENFPSAGLTPSNPVVISDKDWIETISKEIVTDLGKTLQQSWLDKFCAVSINTETLGARETYHRCAYQVTTRAPETLQQFYLKNWQISYQDWQRFISLL